MEEGDFQEPMKDDKELGVNRDWGDGWNNRELDVRQAKFVDRDSSQQMQYCIITNANVCNKTWLNILTACLQWAEDRLTQ